MVRARFTGVNFYQSGEPVEQGEVVELTEEQYEQWAYQFELLEDPDANEANEEPSGETSDAEEGESTTEDEESQEESPDESEKDVGDYTVSELKERLESGEFDDRLDELEVEERSRDDPRTTALEAIEERKDAV